MIYDFYAAEYGWLPSQVDEEDYWLIAEDLVFATMRRHAKAKLDNARHEVMIRGPEGEQTHYDKDGKRVKAGSARTDFKGFEKYTRELEIKAGLVDPEVERLAQELKRADAFWGEAPPIQPHEGDETVTDEASVDS